MKFNIKQKLLTVFILFVVIVAGYGIYYATSPLSMIDMTEETVENSINCKTSYIIREERLFESELSGSVYHHAIDGDRVAKDSLISTVFSGSISSDKLKELKNIDRKIRSHKAHEGISTLHTNIKDAENTIDEMVSGISELSKKNSVSSIAALREDINNLRNGISLSDEDRLESLLEQRRTIEEGIAAEHIDIITDISGVFTTYTDGLELLLVPEDIPSYTGDYIENIVPQNTEHMSQTQIEAGKPVCKIMNNHVWYVIMNIPQKNMENREVGDKVWLRMNSIAQEVVDAQIYHIGQPYGDIVPVTVKCPKYLEGAFSYRRANVDLIFESYSGCKVPIHAIRSDDKGNKYVLGMVGQREYTCYVEIVYTDMDKEIAIIEATETAQHKVTSMERIVTGER